MTKKVLEIDGVWKRYLLGAIGVKTLSDDIRRGLARIRGKDYEVVSFDSVGNEIRTTGADYFWALRDVSLTVEQGDIVALIGHNGSGKSTLLKILSRVTAPTHGRVRGIGRVASLLEVGTGFHPELSGRENIFLNGAIMGMRRNEINGKLAEIIEFSGCGPHICLLYTSPSPRDRQKSRMPSSA